MNVPRPEHPRPQWRRDRWTNLNGTWRFAFDDADQGVAERWELTDAAGLADGPFDLEIVVPFAYHTPASGIGVDETHRVVWYARRIDTADLHADGERLVLHIGAADHDTTVWVNGVQVAVHRGGFTPLEADVTDVARGHDDVVVVRVEDRSGDLEQVRGKQFWRDQSEYIFYRGTTGIWQTVWLEAVPEAAVVEAHVVPSLASAGIDVTMRVTEAAVGQRLRVTVARGDEVHVQDEIRIHDTRLLRRWRLVERLHGRDAKLLEFHGVATWHPRAPRLYDLVLEVLDDEGEVVDRVESYFGMREVGTLDGRVTLNGRPVVLRLVLDQGFWPDGGYTAPSDDAIRADIELAQSLGFNGARKHQKVEDPRYLYWADRLGFLVWEEMPSAYQFSSRYVEDVTRQWQEVVVRDRNHPSVIVWVPMNESWGVPAVGVDPDGRQVHHLETLYHLTRALDPTRLVVSNDGWEHATTDLCTIHDYGDARALRERFQDRETAIHSRPLHHAIYAPGHEHRGEPIVVSEFGGIKVVGDESEWGFHVASDGDELLERYRAFVSAVVDSPVVAGFCWTQLTDVQQEANGLATVDRVPKADPAAIRDATLQGRCSREAIDDVFPGD